VQRNKGNERRRRRRGRATNSTRSAQRNSTPIRETVFTALAVVTDESTRLYRPPKQVKAFVCVEIDMRITDFRTQIENAMEDSADGDQPTQKLFWGGAVRADGRTGFLTSRRMRTPFYVFHASRVQEVAGDTLRHTYVRHTDQFAPATMCTRHTASRKEETHLWARCVVVIYVSLGRSRCAAVESHLKSWG